MSHYPSALILFAVPEDLSDVADILEEHGAEGGLGGCTESGDIQDFLSMRVGQMVEVEFDTDEPLEPIHALVEAMDKAGVAYWGLHDGYTERSRGFRVQGKTYLNPTGRPEDKTELKLGWEDGPPSLDARTLKAAGMTSELAAEICERFTGVTPAPAPKSPWGA